MPHLGAFVPSNYFAFIYVPVYSTLATPWPPSPFRITLPLTTAPGAGSSLSDGCKKKNQYNAPEHTGPVPRARSLERQCNGAIHSRSRVISISIWLDAIYCGLLFFIRFERMCHLGSQAAQRSLKQLPIFSLRTINVLRLSAAFMCSISLIKAGPFPIRVLQSITRSE